MNDGGIRDEAFAGVIRRSKEGGELHCRTAELIVGVGAVTYPSVDGFKYTALAIGGANVDYGWPCAPEVLAGAQEWQVAIDPGGARDSTRLRQLGDEICNAVVTGIV